MLVRRAPTVSAVHRRIRTVRQESLKFTNRLPHGPATLRAVIISNPAAYRPPLRNPEQIVSDFIIIGGGVLGMLSARELAANGASVTLLERAEPGRESSWAGGGIVSPLYPWRYPDSVTALAGWSQQHYPALATELIEDTGIDPELYPCGLLVLAPAEQDTALDWAQRHAQTIEVIDRHRLHELEPAMVGAADSAIWLARVANLRNPRLSQALQADIEHRGVRIETHTEVTELVAEHGRICRVGTNRGDYSLHSLAHREG